MRLAAVRCAVELTVWPKGLVPAQLIQEVEVFRGDVTIRSVSWQFRGNEPDTLYFSLALKEWSEPSGRRKGAGRPIEAQQPRLTRTTTLNSLARRYFGSYGAADAIAKENGLRKWGKNTPIVRHRRFRVGDKIKIPAIPRTAPVGFPSPPRRGGEDGFAFAFGDVADGFPSGAGAGVRAGRSG